MPDLSNKAAHQFWYEYKDPAIYRVISFMEGVEQWTVDEDESLEAGMQRLGQTLEDVGNIDLQNEDDFIRVAAYIKAGRSLRLLQSMDTAHPGAASKLLMHAEEVSQTSDDTPGLFLRRNIVFERLRLLGRVFAPRRFELVLRAIEGDDDE